jgi:hypothetical protein
MGREIRRVPADWDHPTDGGDFVPLFDEDYESACRAWWDAAVKWHRGEVSEEHAKWSEKYPWYWDWNGSPPELDANVYRPAWTEAERTHFQIYENVSEGTPVSPVFASLDEMVAWMILPIDRSSAYNGGADWQCMQGRTLEQAKAFAGDGWAPSLVASGGKVMDGVTAGPELAKRQAATTED